MSEARTNAVAGALVLAVSAPQWNIEAMKQATERCRRMGPHIRPLRTLARPSPTMLGERAAARAAWRREWRR
jgi:hypothetical protein